MKAPVFDGITRDLGAVATRRRFFHLLGGAAALSAGLTLSAHGDGLAKGKNRGKAKTQGQVAAQGKKGQRIIICYQNQTRAVKKKGYQTKYPGATKGACTAKTEPQPVVCTSWIVSGGPDRTTPISVDDDLRMTVNGVEILKDDNGMAGNLPAVSFAAQVGDSLGVVANDVGVACRSLSPLWLHCAATGQKRQLSAGNTDGCAPGRTAGTFFSEVFTISL